MAIRLSAKIDGLKQVRKKFSKAGDAGDAAVRSAIYAVANDLMVKDIIKVTPKDEGDLRDSWYVSKPFKRIGFSEVGFGAKHAPYVHEMPSDVNWSEPGTGNKFIEKPFSARRGRMAKEIAREAKKRFDINKTMADFSGGSAPTKPKVKK